jgi:predicted RNA-binding protein with TRAM domain
MSYVQAGWSGRSYGNYSSKASPVEEGKEYEANITELSRRGDGIAKIQGFVVFVPNTKAGDSVKFKVIRVARSYATAEVI